MPSKYRKKPGTVEAMQWTGKNFDDLYSWLGKFNIMGIDKPDSASDSNKSSWIQVWQDAKLWVTLIVGEWIVKNPNSLEVVGETIFETLYDQVLYETIVPKISPPPQKE